MTRRYILIDRGGHTIYFVDDIKVAYKAASRHNRRKGSNECVEILDRKTGEKYSLTCLSRRRAKVHGQELMDRFYEVMKAFDVYERTHGTVTPQGVFAYEMFDIGFSLI